MTAPDPDLLSAIRARGISRITHFSPSRNLPHILATDAILPTATLDDRDVGYQHTDPSRADGHRTYVCGNIEYPNMWYFNIAHGRDNAINYSDWVVFLLDSSVAATPGTRFAPRNAAKFGGSEIRDGVEGLDRLYAPIVGNRRRDRSHRAASPTDVQAEILIPGEISLSAVTGIVVPDQESLARETGRLRLLQQDPDRFSWFVSVGMYDKFAVTDAVRRSVDLTITGPCDTRPEEVR